MSLKIRSLYIVTSLFFLIFPGCVFSQLNKEHPKAVNGVLDLRNWDGEKDVAVSLDGEWRFFWNKLIGPDNAFLGKTPEMSRYVKLPAKWNNYTVNGRRLDGDGYATYTLTLFHHWAGKSRIVLQVSNFHHKDGGPLKEIRVGPSERLYALKTRKQVVSLFLISSLLTMGLYHLNFILLRNRYESPLFFGIFCCIIALRSAITGERFILYLWPGISWDILIKLEYLTFCAALPVFALYIASLFPREFSKKVLYFIQSVSLVYFLLVLFTRARLFTQFLQPFQIFSILVGLYVTVVFFKAFKRERKGILVISTGFLVLFASAVHDMLEANHVIQTDSSFQAGLFVFHRIQEPCPVFFNVGQRHCLFPS